MTEYFIHDGTKEVGPFTLIELGSQKISAETPIWHKGLGGWIKAKDLEELEPLLALKVSPPPFNRQNKKQSQKAFFSVYLVAGIVLITASLIWYFFAADKAYVSTPTEANGTEHASPLAGMSKEEVEKQRLSQEIAIRNLNYRNNWNRYIWVNHNKYKKNLFGGIFDLQVGIVNETEYVLDEVNVLVHYIKSNGATYKIEPAEIYNVPAHGKIFVPVPASDRGTSVIVEINAISSKKMDFCYSSEIDIRRSKDPYRCTVN